MISHTANSDQKNQSLLVLGNKSLRRKDYICAIQQYVGALREYPLFSKIIAGNLSFAKKKYRKTRSTAVKTKVGVCGWELSHNAVGRAYTLAQLYKQFAEVEIIGVIFAEWGKEVWSPIRDTQIPIHKIVLEDESEFLQQAINLVSNNPYDIVHLSKPRAVNIFIGALYKIIWNSTVLIDIDDEELAFVDADSSISIDLYLQKFRSLPKLADLAGKDWTRLAAGLVREFDGITVSGPALKDRYGGEIIRHARDENNCVPSHTLRAEERRRLGISPEKKVFVFCGTPREHKGLLDVASLVTKLGGEQYLLLIAGDFPDLDLKKELKRVAGNALKFIDGVSFNSAYRVLAVADYCVLYQDPAAEVSKYQVPAKISDALAMGVPVFLTEVSAVADIIAAGAAFPIKGDLFSTVSSVINNKEKVDQLKKEGQKFFRSELTFAHNSKKLKKLMLGAMTSSSVEIGSGLARVISSFDESKNLLVERSLVETIDIIVPVFNALDDVKKCLISLDEHRDGFAVKIFVINDGSDNQTTEWLRTFCNSKPEFTLIEHSENKGYTKAINSGLRLSAGLYVVTQNSDTIVTRGWLKGLVRCMSSEDSIGVVGPLSNAASWQNVPNLHSDDGAFAINELPDGVTVQEMAQKIAEISIREYPKLPFVNGFCFMIKRKVIDAIGIMDETNFPIGYGEENDFCIRAMDAGFELAVADDVYVYHAKSKSFGAERRKKLSQEGSEMLRRKHGADRYDSLVRAIPNRIASLNSLRERLNKAIKFDMRELKNILPVINRDALPCVRICDMHEEEIKLIFPPAFGTKNYEVDSGIFGPSLIIPYQSDRVFSPEGKLLSIGVQIHFYYPDLFDEVVYFLKSIPYRFSLYVSVIKGEDVVKWQEKFELHIPNASVTVRSFENRGRDISSFVAGFNEELAQHEYICHLHTKRSLHNSNKADWRRQLFVNLLGSANIVATIFKMFEENKHLGLVFPEFHHSLLGQISWGTNFEVSSKLALKLGLKISSDELVTFPAGSMFWARTSALMPLLKSGIKYSDFPEEAKQVDGTLAHAVERMLGEIVVQNGYHILQTKSEKQHSLIFYYPKKWSYTNKYDRNELDLLVKNYYGERHGNARIVVYSALMGAYDPPVLHEVLDTRFDYVLFSDSPIPDAGAWDVRCESYPAESPVRKARYVKTHPHVYFKDYDIAIWIDSNVLINGDIMKYVQMAIDQPDIPLFGIPHPHRNCLYEEALAVVQAKKDTAGIVEKQVARIAKENYPKNNGLIETNFIVINLRHGKVDAVFDEWWSMINSGSHRDQLSINYALWKNDVQWRPLMVEKKSLRDSFEFAYFGHGRNSGYSRPSK